MLWENLLKHRNFSDTTDFFAAGGHSLLAAQLVAKINRLPIDVRVTIRDLFDHPTVDGLVGLITSGPGK